MFVVVNGFISHENNLLGNGGRSIKVSCIPVGDYVKEKQNSYKRVTDDEGNFTYPQIPENIKKRVKNIRKTRPSVVNVKPKIINYRELEHIRNIFFLVWKK